MLTVLDFFYRHDRHLATAVSLVLVILIGLSLAHSLLFVLDAMNPPDPGSAPAVSNKASNSFSGPRVSSLELFGKHEETGSVPRIVDAPDTRLDLELKGVFIAEEETMSTAIVSRKGKPGELFYVGNRLPGNVILAAVHDDHVLIRRGSRVEKLAFTDSAFRVIRDEGSSQAPRNRVATTGQTAGERPEAVDAVSPTPTSQPDLKVGATRPGNLRTAIEHYADRIQRNPEDTLAELGISPVSAEEPKGYRLGRQAARPELQQAGLQSGDTILSVNGQALGNAASDARLARQLASSKSVRVEVQRGQRRFFLTLPLPE